MKTLKFAFEIKPGRNLTKGAKVLLSTLYIVPRAPAQSFADFMSVVFCSDDMGHNPTHIVSR